MELKEEKIVVVTDNHQSKAEPSDTGMGDSATDQIWSRFRTGSWRRTIDVRSFIQTNYLPYVGDDSFLEGITEKNTKLFEKMKVLFEDERQKGVSFVDVSKISTLTSHKAGYVDKDLEEIVGLQGERPLERGLMPSGGVKVVEKSCEAYGYTLDPEITEMYTKYAKNHNDAVFDLYNDDIRAARKSGIITGLPDAYGRGRIIGDYRRVALYGVDILLDVKMKEKKQSALHAYHEENMRLVEEIAMQIQSLKELKIMASYYGFDISKPARNAKEAIQWLYFGYLGAIKEQNGAAMSIGRCSTFIDIYIQKDIELGILNEKQAQELIDQFVMKLRMVRFLRTPEYNELFSGDPVWVTESIGGMGTDGRTLVTKTSFRILQTLFNLGPAPEPNLTVLWSSNLPQGFKEFCSKVSIATSSVQYENDDLMRQYWGDDYGIACCVSAMRIGKQMQFFGARCNIAKTLLYAINGGVDEISGAQVAPKFEPIKSEYLNFEEVVEKFNTMINWVTEVYISALNKIHYAHDRYAYEKIEFALHDRDIYRTMACGIAGLSVCADSLSAIKYAKVKPIRNEKGIAVDFEVEGDFPKFGNNDDRVDEIAYKITKVFMKNLEKYRTYRNSVPTQSILTITSNVVYGKKTGNTPDGRRAGMPFGPGANPMSGRETSGSIAAMASLAKLPYEYAKDGISYTWSTVPAALGREEDERVDNLIALLDGFFKKQGHHINVNVFNRETLLDAMDHPEKYPQLTIRVSGYAVNFIKLTKEQQMDVVNRTFHKYM